jgi:hypothetical protein
VAGQMHTKAQFDDCKWNFVKSSEGSLYGNKGGASDETVNGGTPRCVNEFLIAPSGDREAVSPPTSMHSLLTCIRLLQSCSLAERDYPCHVGNTSVISGYLLLMSEPDSRGTRDGSRLTASAPGCMIAQGAPFPTYTQHEAPTAVCAPPPDNKRIAFRKFDLE